MLKKFKKSRKFKRFLGLKKFLGSKKSKKNRQPKLKVIKKLKKTKMVKTRPRKKEGKPKPRIAKKLTVKGLKVAAKQSSVKKTKKQKIFKYNYSKVVIKVVGIGGCGGNVITNMITKMRGKILENIDFIAINTDAQDLDNSKAQHKIYIGKNLTKGLGTGMNPELGHRAAEESRTEIAEALKGADLVFIIAGLGGGTGTGGVPVVAQIAKEIGALTLAAITKPFSFEGTQRKQIAEMGLKKFIEIVDTTIIVPNDQILKIITKDTNLIDAFSLCNDVLTNAVRGIAEPLLRPGIINLDLADVKTIMTGAGPAAIGIGQASGKKRAIEATQKAINFPLLGISISGAKGILFSVIGRKSLTLFEVNEVAKTISASTDPDAKIIFGVIQDEGLNRGELKVTVVATGFSDQDSMNLKDASK